MSNGFNPLASLMQGVRFRNQLEQNERTDKINALQQALSERVGKAGFDPSQSVELQQLAALDPNAGMRSLSVFQELDDSRQRAFFQDARKGRQMLESGDGKGFLDLASDRLDNVQRLGGDPSDVMDILQTFNSGDIQGTINKLKQAEQAGMQVTDSKGNPFLKDLAAKNKKTALSEPEKNFVRLTGLRKQLDSAQKSGNKAAIQAAQSQLDDFQALTGKFGPTAQEKADIAVTKAANTELSKQAAAASKDAFDGLRNTRKSIGNMTDAIRALDKGANTGPIISQLPSFREASIDLDNIRGKMGLDIVGATTFGALSESELAFALDTALPTNLQPQDLKAWLIRKRDAQKKLGKELMRAATFLGKPGNTIAKFIEQETTAGRLSFDESAGQPTVTDEDEFAGFKVIR